MQILASFCNVGRLEARYALARFLYDGTRLSFLGFVDLDVLIQGLPFSGVTGLCVHDGVLYIGLQRTPSALAIVSLLTGSSEVLPLTRVLKIHSMVPHRGQIVIASTGSDSVTAFDPITHKEAVLFSLDPRGIDTVHINGVTINDGQVVVSMLGMDTGGLRFGEVRNLSSGEILLGGLNYPHSVMSKNGEVHVLESGSGQLLRQSVRGWRNAGRFFGWIRGLLLQESLSIVGRSGFRVHSGSFGLDRTAPLGLTQGAVSEAERSALYALDQYGLGVSIDTTDIGSEIYDVVAIPEDTVLPMVGPEDTAVARAARARDPRTLARLALDLKGRAGIEARLAAALANRDGVAALGYALEALETKPGDAALHQRVSDLALALHDRALALKHAQQASELTPEDVPTLVALATRALRYGELELAEGAALQAVSLEPRGATIRYHLARVLEAKGDLSGAVRAAQQALDIEPTVTNRTRLAAFHRRAGDQSSALEALEGALAERPDDPEALTERVELELGFGRAASAVRWARRALSLVQPPRLGLSLLFARALAEAGEQEEASRVLNALLESHSGDPAVFLQLARLELSVGRKEAARAVLQDGLAAVPGDLKLSALLKKVDRGRRGKPPDSSAF